jgi:hypothetical protein
MEDGGAFLLRVMVLRSFLDVPDEFGFDIWTEDVVQLDS